MTTATVTPAKPRPKGAHGALRRLDMVLFSVAAIMLLNQVPITAKEGPSVLFWTLVLLVFFFVPYGLITAELGSTYADTGGIYSWVQRAFGGFWGTQVSWWYWINVGIWLPSVYLMFATLLGQTFDFKVGFWWTVTMAVALIWINFVINVVALDTSKWVANAAAIVTVAIMLLIGVVGLVHVITSGSATEWTAEGMLPSGTSYVLVGVVVYNFLGFELMSSASEEMRDPRRDVPRSILTSGVLIAVFYLIATVGMLLLVATDGFNRTNGLFRALAAGIGDTGLAAFAVTLLGIGALYCFFAALVPWTIGANRAAAEAARRGDLPPVLGRTSKRFRTPVAAAMATAVVGTVFTVGYGVVMELSTSPKVETLFWNLFAFSTLVFLISYLVMAAAFLKLRHSDAEAERPYRVPGGIVGAWVAALLVFGFIAASMVFFMWWPGATLARAGYQDYVIQVGAGLGVVLAVGVLFALLAPRWRRRVAAEAALSRPVRDHPELEGEVRLEGIAPDDASALHDRAAVGPQPLRHDVHH
jgi:amino acid transporter